MIRPLRARHPWLVLAVAAALLLLVAWAVASDPISEPSRRPAAEPPK